MCEIFQCIVFYYIYMQVYVYVYVYMYNIAGNDHTHALLVSNSN